MTVPGAASGPRFVSVMAYVTVSPTAALGAPFPTQVAVTDRSATGSAWAAALVAGTSATLATTTAQSRRNRCFITRSPTVHFGPRGDQPRHPVEANKLARSTDHDPVGLPPSCRARSIPLQMGAVKERRAQRPAIPRRLHRTPNPSIGIRTWRSGPGSRHRYGQRRPSSSSTRLAIGGVSGRLQPDPSY